MLDIRLLPISWSHGAEHHSIRLKIPELTGGSWQGWAWYKVLTTWIEAQAVESIDKIDTEKRVHLLLLKNVTDGRVICVYPVSTFTATTTISYLEAEFHLDGRRITSDDRQPARAGCVIGTSTSAKDLHTLVEACVFQARALVSGIDVGHLQHFSEGEWKQGPFGGIGFCTWSSLGEDIRPNYDNMSDLLNRLADTKIPIKSFILDDGWHVQKTYGSGDASPYRCKTGPEETRGTWQLRGLWDFKAYSELHPDGLEGCVRQTKQLLGEECEVGVWLALTGGYWDGVHPDSPLIKRYNCRPYPTSRHRLPGVENIPFTPNYIPGGHGTIWLPPPEDSLRYWTDWFTYIRSCGATFLKVDNQAGLVILDGVTGAECQYALWHNMLRASDQVFGTGRVIHCMAQHEGIHGGVQGLGLLTGGERVVCRNSDDFGLVGKKADVQQQHIFTNLTNSILTNHLALIPDPDMFMTADQTPLYHALLRVMYPGPLLFSDKPGHHDLDLISRMTAKDASGAVQVVRTNDYARPLARRALDIDVIGSSTGKGLWASSRVQGGGAIIGVWNVREDETNAKVQDSLTVEDIEDALETELSSDMLVVEMDLGGLGLKRGKLIDRHDQGAVMDVKLDNLEASCFWVIPVHQVGTVKMAVMGLVDKMVGAVAIEGLRNECTSLEFKVGLEGVLGFAFVGPASDVDLYIDGASTKLPKEESIEGFEGSLYTLSISCQGSPRIVSLRAR